MKYAKYVLITVFGMAACLQTASAANYPQSLGGSRADLERKLGFNQDHLGKDAMFYAKVDAYSTWVEDQIIDNEISPKMGLGFRYRNHNHGFDVSLSGHMPTEFKYVREIYHDDTLAAVDAHTFTGIRNYVAGQLTYLYYTQPISRSTFYFGAGAGIDRHTIEFKNENVVDNFGFISGLVTAGYQFDLSNTMKSFLQFQVSQPAYYYEKVNNNIYGLSEMSQWIPTVSMSIGVGF